MSKIEWLELAKEEILYGDGRRAIKFINEVIEMIKIEERECSNE